MHWELVEQGNQSDNNAAVSVGKVFIGLLVGLAILDEGEDDPTHPSATGLNPAKRGVHLSLPSSECMELQQRAMHWELEEQNDQSDKYAPVSVGKVFIGLLVGLAILDDGEDDVTQPSAIGLNPSERGVHLS
jgi:hypothetical protein